MEATEGKEEYGIYIESDAPHSAFRGASKSNIFALDHQTHKIIEYVVITKMKEMCSLRHESMATKSIRAKLSDQGIKRRAYVHDQSSAISNVIEACDPQTDDQLDIWHAIKSPVKALHNISSGPKYKEGEFCSEKLGNKKESLQKNSL